MAIISPLKLASVLFTICMVFSAGLPATQAAISCSKVSDSQSPCRPHLTRSGHIQATPPADCCAGVKSVSGMAQQRGDHKAICECMKASAKGITGLNYELAAKLPQNCGVTMSYTFGPNTDCTKVVD